MAKRPELGDAAHKAEVARITGLLTRWATTLGLGFWRLDVDFYQRTPKRLRGMRVGTGEWQPLADCLVRWEYVNARLAFSTPATSTLSDDELEETVLHELVHVLLAELAQARGRPGSSRREAHHERVATTLARAFTWTRRRYEHQENKETKE